MTNAGQSSIESGIRPTVNNPIERFDRSALYRVTRLISASFGLLLCAGCVAYGYDSYDPRAHHEHDVPAGHLPPPGECRIWYPDRPAGQQPPPGSCRKLEWQVPSGAILIRG